MSHHGGQWRARDVGYRRQQDAAQRHQQPPHRDRDGRPPHTAAAATAGQKRSAPADARDAEAARRAAARPRVERTGSVNDDPNIWKECFSQKENRPYYYNTQTGASIWSRPECWKSKGQPATAAASTPASAQPSSSATASTSKPHPGALRSAASSDASRARSGSPAVLPRAGSSAPAGPTMLGRQLSASSSGAGGMPPSSTRSSLDKREPARAPLDPATRELIGRYVEGNPWMAQEMKALRSLAQAETELQVATLRRHVIAARLEASAHRRQQLEQL